MRLLSMSQNEKIGTHLNSQLSSAGERDSRILHTLEPSRSQEICATAVHYIGIVEDFLQDQ